MRCAGKILAASVLALAVCAASKEPAVFRFTRPLPVQSSGWVKVPIDPVTRGHMTPDGRDLRLYDPAGEEVGTNLWHPQVQREPLKHGRWPLPKRPEAGTSTSTSGPK